MEPPAVPFDRNPHYHSPAWRKAAAIAHGSAANDIKASAARIDRCTAKPSPILMESIADAPKISVGTQSGKASKASKTPLGRAPSHSTAANPPPSDQVG